MLYTYPCPEISLQPHPSEPPTTELAMLRFTGGCFISLWFANPHVRSFEGSPIGAAAVCLLPRWLALLLGATTSPDVHCILTSERQQTFWPNETYLTAAAWSSFSFVLCLCWRENGVCKVLKVEGLVGLAKCRQAMESQLKWTDLSEFLPRFCGDTFSLLWCVTVLQWYSGPVLQVTGTLLWCVAHQEELRGGLQKKSRV